MPETLHTDRLTLRPPCMQDAAAVASLVGEFEVARWLTHVPHPYTELDAQAFIARQMEGSGDTFLVFEATTLIGCIGTARELGYWFGIAFWGRGFATEAARIMVQRHFAKGGDTLISGYFLGNARSAHVLDKLGFQPTELSECAPLSLGTPVTQQRMALDRTTWEAAA